MAEVYDGIEYAMDLSQDDIPNTGRNAGLWNSDDTNPNQDFILIPTDNDAYFICGKRSGAVIGVKADRQKEVMGFMPENQGAKLDASSLVVWVKEKTEGSETFVLKNKIAGRYVGFANTPANRADSLVLVTKEKAITFRFKEKSTHLYYSSGDEKTKFEDPPRPTQLATADYPSTTDPVLISEKFVPYFMVGESKTFPAWNQRVQTQPIYRIREYRSWRRELCKEWHGKAEMEDTVLDEDQVTKYQFQTLKIEQEKTDSVTSSNHEASAGVQLIPGTTMPRRVGINISSEKLESTERSKEVNESGGNSGTSNKTVKSVTVKYGITPNPVLYVTWLSSSKVCLERIDPDSQGFLIESSFEAIDPRVQKVYSYPSSSVQE